MVWFSPRSRLPARALDGTVRWPMGRFGPKSSPARRAKVPTRYPRYFTPDLYMYCIQCTCTVASAVFAVCAAHTQRRARQTASTVSIGNGLLQLLDRMGGRGGRIVA